jgi:hypothetical protein
MLKLLLQITAVIVLLIVSAWIFIHLLPWAIAILALLALAVKAYHFWITKNGGTLPSWWHCGGGKGPDGQPIA